WFTVSSTQRCHSDDRRDPASPTAKHEVSSTLRCHSDEGRISFSIPPKRQPPPATQLDVSSRPKWRDPVSGRERSMTTRTPHARLVSYCLRAEIPPAVGMTSERGRGLVACWSGTASRNPPSGPQHAASGGTHVPVRVLPMSPVRTHSARDDTRDGR